MRTGPKSEGPPLPPYPFSRRDADHAGDNARGVVAVAGARGMIGCGRQRTGWK